VNARLSPQRQDYGRGDEQKIERIEKHKTPQCERTQTDENTRHNRPNQFFAGTGILSFLRTSTSVGSINAPGSTSPKPLHCKTLRWHPPTARTRQNSHFHGQSGHFDSDGVLTARVRIPKTQLIRFVRSASAKLNITRPPVRKNYPSSPFSPIATGLRNPLTRLAS
jgi:hypothetical protein